MLYIIENISNEDININGGILKCGKEITVSNIESFVEFIKSKKLKIKSTISEQEYGVSYEERNKQDVSSEMHENFVTAHMREKVLDSFFKLYFNENINDSELDMLKWFYKDIGFTSDISKTTLSLLENVTNKEELIEVLLNNIYPELIYQHFNRHQLKNK